MENDYLGPLERRVMSHIWDRGAATVAEIVDVLNAASDRKLAYTTVMTILVRLHDKGYVSRAASGRSYVYRPIMSEAELKARVGRRELENLIERYGAASVAQFAEELGRSRNELTTRLRALADSGQGRNDD